MAEFQQEIKVVGHHTRLREDDDLPLWRIKKKPPFFNAAR